MRRVILYATIIFALYGSAFAQKLAEPKLLGSWFGGEDPSEFLLHTVMEYSQALLEENLEGKLIVRICSSDEFSTAFLKAPLNPLSASQYNQFRLLVPNEKIFIARSSKCISKTKYIYIQYWFVPAKNALEYEEIFSLNSIYYKNFYVSEFEQKERKLSDKEFDENLKNFIFELKSNPATNGFIVHNSKSQKIKLEIEKVTTLAKKEGVEMKRIKTVIKVRLNVSKKGQLKPTKDENSFPTLAVIRIEK